MLPCPSKHELCVRLNMKLELRNKGSPFQLAPKPTHNRRAIKMGQRPQICKYQEILHMLTVFHHFWFAESFLCTTFIIAICRIYTEARVKKHEFKFYKFIQIKLITNLRHCLPLNFFLIPLGVETTSPFLYLWGVAGKDLGDDGVDRGLAIMLLEAASRLELDVRDCEVSDLLWRPPCVSRAPGVKEIER